jgi:hypothetical protein
MGKKTWTEEQDNFLKTNLKDMGWKQLAEKLDKGIGSIKNRVYRLDLHKGSRWTKEDEEFLRVNYGKMTASQLADIFDVKIGAIYQKCFKLGIYFGPDTAIKKWTEEEENFLRANYLNIPYEELGKKLNRTTKAIGYKCDMLGLVISREWTKEEEEFLRANYEAIPIKEIAQHLNRTPSATSHKLKKLKLNQDRKRKKNKEVQDFIKNNHQNMTREEMGDVLGLGKDRLARICRKLGIFSDNAWTEEEDKFLKDNYLTMPYEEISLKLNRTVFAIRNRRKLFKIQSSKVFPVQIGERFGRLEVLSETDRRSSGCIVYICRCDCDGKLVYVNGHSLRQGSTQSCGCYRLFRIREATRKAPKEYSYNKLELRCRLGAKNRKDDKDRKEGIPYKLTTPQFRGLVVQICDYCGSKPQPWNWFYTKEGERTKTHNATSKEWMDQQWICVNGIDRINSSLGYTIDNCVPCCTRCNRMKMVLLEEDFIFHIFKICAFQIAKAIKVKNRNIIKILHRLVRSALQSL